MKSYTMIICWKLFSLLMLSFSLATTQHLNAQNSIIPFDTAIIAIDGVMQPEEWAIAQKIYIRTSSKDSIQIRMKHDGSAFYFAFSGKLGSANMSFPEILFDPRLQRTSKWIRGQWWFHI